MANNPVVDVLHSCRNADIFIDHFVEIMLDKMHSVDDIFIEV